MPSVAPLTPVSQLSTFTRSPSLSSLSTLTDTTEDHSPSFRVIDIPAAFKKELARFPVINIPISANWNDQTVSLQELHVNLGGNQFNVVSRRVMSRDSQTRFILFFRTMVADLSRPEKHLLYATKFWDAYF